MMGSGVMVEVEVLSGVYNSGRGRWVVMVAGWCWCMAGFDDIPHRTSSDLT